MGLVQQVVAHFADDSKQWVVCIRASCIGIEVQIMMRFCTKISPCGSHYEAMDCLYSQESLSVYARNAMDARYIAHGIVHGHGNGSPRNSSRCLNRSLEHWSLLVGSSGHFQDF